MSKMEKTFYDPSFTGTAQGGIFLRSDLGPFIKELEDKGYTVAGIIIDESHNLQILTRPLNPIA